MCTMSHTIAHTKSTLHMALFKWMHIHLRNFTKFGHETESRVASLYYFVLTAQLVISPTPLHQYGVSACRNLV